MLGEQRGSFLPVPCRVREHALQLLLPLPHRRQQQRPRAAPQHEQQQPEHDEGPDDEATVYGERAGTAPSRLLRERPEHQNVTFPCITNATTAANSATPSTSAAAMIMAVWMRALFSGWRAMPSTA